MTENRREMVEVIARCHTVSFASSESAGWQPGTLHFRHWTLARGCETIGRLVARPSNDDGLSHLPLARDRRPAA